MDINIEGILILRNAIIEQACFDYVKARKFLLQNPNPVLIAKNKEINSTKWIDIRKLHKQGDISNDEYEYLEELHKMTLFKQRYIKSQYIVADISWWFTSKQFSIFNLDLDQTTMINKLERRALYEIGENI